MHLKVRQAQFSIGVVDQRGTHPVALCHLGDEPFASLGSAIPPRHVDLGPSLVNEDRAPLVDPRPPGDPVRTLLRDVGISCAAA